MHRPAIRTAFGRARLHLTRSNQSTRSGVRLFSTTLAPRDDAPKPTTPRPAPTLRQRSVAAASQLASLKPASPSGVIDLRSLRSRPPAVRAPGVKVISLRDLRGQRPNGIGGARGPRGVRGGRPGSGPRQARTARNKYRTATTSESSAMKMTWTPKEQEILNNMEQGVVTPYTPKVTFETLAGYTSPVASKTTQSQVGRALNGMRILAGGRPFDDTVVYDDPRRRLRQYRQAKEPLFFDTMEQKQWLIDQRPGTEMHPPKEETKTAIIAATILGKYDSRAPQFVVKEDVLGMVKKYQKKDTTWRTNEMDRFQAKLQALLPGAKPAAAAQKKAKA